MNFASVHHSFDIDIASAYGIEEAILIHHFQYWVRFNRTKSQNIRDGKCWVFQTRKEMLSIFPYFNFEKVRRICESLVKKKVLVTNNYNINPVDKTLWYAFVDEKKFGVDGGNSKNVYERQICPSKGKFATSNKDIYNASSSSKSYLNKGNAYKSLSLPKPKKALEEGHCRALPSSIEKKEKGKKGALRKYPRTPEHEDKFQWFLRLKNANPELDLDESAMSVLANQYSAKKLQDTWQHLKYRISKGCKCISMAAMFRKLLKEENSPVNDNCLKNKELAKKFRDRKGWPNLELKDRYCCDSRRPDTDIPYLLDEETFMRKLEEMFEDLTSQRYSPHPTDYEDYEDDYDY